MKHISQLFAIAALIAVIGLSLAACQDPVSSSSPTPVTFESVTADGGASVATTELTLTFSQAITGLNANDITITGVDGITKGTLGSIGPVYTLPISGFTAGGELTVAVAKSGFAISGSPQTVDIFYTAPTVPGVPQHFTATAGDTEVILTWTAPTSNGGSTIIRYEVSSDNGATWVDASSTIGHTFTGLDNGTEYTFKVRAVNAIGNSAEATDTATPSADATVPTAPQNFTATAGDTEVVLEWTAPASNGGSAITKYEVSSDNGATWVDASSTIGHTFTGLDNDTAYTFRVRAVNAIGNGAEAADTAIPASGATVPTAPQNFTATAGDTEVVLEWTAPASNGGSAITGYQVSSNNGSSWVSASSATGHTFTGLDNDTAYTFRVRAVNAIGNGAEATDTATPTAALSATVPGAPQNFTATAGDTLVTLAWDPPASDGGSTIIRYEVSSTNGADWITASSTTGHQFVGLNNGIEFTFKVRAVNAIGNGAEATDTATPTAATCSHNWSAWTLTSPITSIDTVQETRTCTLCSEPDQRNITMAAYLASLPENTAATPYTFVVNIGEFHWQSWTFGQALFENKDKFVCFDMSGSTFSEFYAYAFSNGTNLTGITMPATITTIGTDAFRNCPLLTSITLPANITTIGTGVFRNCTGLTSITLPASINSIGDTAFDGCTNLSSVTFDGTIPSANFNVTSPFPGDLREKFYATNTANGTPGLYTRILPSTVWTAPIPIDFTLTPDVVTVNDDNLIRTVEVSGTATGDITLDTSDLPNEVTAIVSGTTITITGVRPATEVPPVTGTFDLGVTREGVIHNIAVTVNLTTTWVPPAMEYIITGSGTAFTATRGGTTVTNANGVTIANVITAIRADAAGNDCSIQFGNGTDVLNIGAVNVSFNTTGATWGKITLLGSITSNSAMANPTIAILNDVNVDSKANITNTNMSGAAFGNGVNNSAAMITISGGTITSASSAATIRASFNTLTISGGTVSNTHAAGHAIVNNSSGAVGTVTISGGTVSSNGFALESYAAAAQHVLSGNPAITGRIRTAPGMLSVNAGFAPQAGRTYTLDFETYTANMIAVTGGGSPSRLANFALHNVAALWGLQVSGANLTIQSLFTPVTNITGVPTTATGAMPLTLTGTVVPATATNSTISWSVVTAGTTGASIATGTNILNTTAAGTATVRATITNGRSTTENYTQDFTITVSAPLPFNYVITGGPTTFTATRGTFTIGTANTTLANVITAIRTNANGANCEIQFGSGGTNVLNIGTGTADFNTTGGTWGAITLRGRLTSAITGNSSSLNLNSQHLTVTSTADIANTGGGIAIRSASNSLTISGGRVEATTNCAILTFGNNPPEGGGGGRLVISGTAMVTSAVPRQGANQGTIGQGTGVYWNGVVNVEINGGTVQNTGAGHGIYVYSPVTVSGGTITSVNSTALLVDANITISGGTITITDPDSSHYAVSNISNSFVGRIFLSGNPTINGEIFVRNNQNLQVNAAAFNPSAGKVYTLFIPDSIPSISPGYTTASIVVNNGGNPNRLAFFTANRPLVREPLYAQLSDHLCVRD
ncbi:MAG: fibronectin type III domain-containing protein [Treponema sp.]|nr:fibronectin type III domain-containing protein [Treponema sp.]